MVDIKLMLAVVMLWTGSLTLSSPQHQPNMMRKFWEKPVCGRYVLPENSMWIPRTNCQDNKQYKCKPGYRQQVQTICTNGQWHVELKCRECYYKYTNDSYLTFDPILRNKDVTGKAECEEMCKNYRPAICTVSQSFNNECYLYSNPVIYYSENAPVDQCQQKCTEMNECLTLMTVFNTYCALLNVALDNLPVGMKVNQSIKDVVIAEKLC